MQDLLENKERLLSEKSVQEGALKEEMERALGDIEVLSLQVNTILSENIFEFRKE